MRPGWVVYLVAVALVVVTLDWLMVVPRWVIVAVMAGSVALAGAAYGRRRG